MRFLTHDVISCSNPSPVVNSNGSILLMYRGTPCDLAGANCSNAWKCVRQGIAVAQSWQGDFKRRPEPLELDSTSEDAFFWQDKLRGGYHLLTHSWRTCGEPDPATPNKPNRAAGSCGAYSWSADTYTWQSAPAPFYNASIRWDNGSTSELKSRQRPQIAFDGATGSPLYLFNGVSSVVAGEMRSWTLAAPFRRRQ